VSGLGETYECYVCHGTFKKTRTDEEALAEAEAAWIRTDEPQVICGDCYAEVSAWAQLDHPEYLRLDALGPVPGAAAVGLRRHLAPRVVVADVTLVVRDTPVEEHPGRVEYAQAKGLRVGHIIRYLGDDRRAAFAPVLATRRPVRDVVNYSPNRGRHEFLASTALIP